MKHFLHFTIILILLNQQLYAQNVGIGMPTPQQKLHIGGVSGTIRVEGLGNGGNFITIPTVPTDNLIFANPNGDLNKMPNGTVGQVPKINASGTLAWANAPVKYEVKGVNVAALTNQYVPILMPDLTITFIPKNPSVSVFFFAMGKANIPEKPIQFQLRVNGTPVILWRASSEDSMGMEWASAMNYPVTVTPGIAVTIEIYWAEISTFGAYQINTGVGTPVARTLMVLDM